MSTFSDRTFVSNIIIEALIKNYWEPLAKNYQIIHETYGYETHISETAQRLLKSDYSKTSKHIRFTPDYIVVRKIPDEGVRTILLEYKVTKTPRFTLGEMQWNQGQIEADAWENYVNLSKVGLHVAILNYCPYHSRPLLCDFPNEDWVAQERRRTNQSRGSGTDYVNIHLNHFRTFDEFMEQEFKIPKVVTERLLHHGFFDLLRKEPTLQIAHHHRSNYRNVKTGDNWLPRYRLLKPI